MGIAPSRTILGLASVIPVALAHGVTFKPVITASAPSFVIQLPEPSGAALLAIDLISVGALVLVFRRRDSRGTKP